MPRVRGSPSMTVVRGPGGRAVAWPHQAAVFLGSEPGFSIVECPCLSPRRRNAEINLGDSGKLISRRRGRARALPPGPEQSLRIY